MGMMSKNLILKKALEEKMLHTSIKGAYWPAYVTPRRTNQLENICLKTASEI